MQLGNFPKFRPKNSKLSILPENWQSWHIGGADSRSRLSKFWPQNPFLGKFGSKKSKLFCLKIGTYDNLEELILIPDLGFWNSNCKIHFWANLGQKSQNCPFCLKIGTHGFLEELILHPDLVFQNSDPKIHFWVNLGQKSQSSLFCLKIGRHGILEELILHPHLDFQNSDPKIHFWANLGQKIPSIRFVWKLACRVFRRCWFLFQH